MGDIILSQITRILVVALASPGVDDIYRVMLASRATDVKRSVVV